MPRDRNSIRPCPRRPILWPPQEADSPSDRDVRRHSGHNHNDVPSLDISQIMEVLPHRPPMLLVDRILDYQTGVKSIGLKNVTMNETYFDGHYPGKPIMPGVLIVEFMAQAGAVILLTDPKFKGLVPVIGGIDEVRFRRQVVPGDQLIAEVFLDRLRGTIGWMRATARVGDEVAAEMKLTFKLVPVEA